MLHNVAYQIYQYIMLVKMKIFFGFISLCVLVSPGFLSAQDDQAPPELKIEAVRADVYIHVSYAKLGDKWTAANGLIVASEKGVVVIDTPWDSLQTVQLLQWIETELKMPVHLVIPTHSHDDCLAGTSAFRARGIKVVSTGHIARRAQERGVAAPDSVLADSQHIDLGDKTLLTYYPGAGHVAENIVVYLPQERLLFGGCFIRSVKSRNLGYTAEADLEAWPHSVHRVLARFPDLEVVVPGHGHWSGPEALHHTLDLLSH